MLGRQLPKPRQFRYEPLYYDPDKEEKEGHRITFKRQRSRAMTKHRSIFWMMLLVSLILYLMWFLGKLGRS